MLARVSRFTLIRCCADCTLPRLCLVHSMLTVTDFCRLFATRTCLLWFARLGLTFDGLRSTDDQSAFAAMISIRNLAAQYAQDLPADDVFAWSNDAR